MNLTDLVILIPSHSLEDFPTELGESESSSLLNAFAVAWHPRLLAAGGVIPSWQRADEPSDPTAGQLLFAPTACDDWLSHGWADRAREAGAFVVSGISERDEMIAAALAVFPPGETTPADSNRSDGSNGTDIDPELVADFLALGSCHLQMELLTRHMHHFGNLDEVHLQREAVLGAEAALAGDATTARTHLQSCFESLHEARERFYPVDCYLVDLCLLIPEVADEQRECLRQLVLDDKPVNLMLTAADAETIATADGDLAELIREAWARETLDIVGGDQLELPVPLVPLESLLWDLSRGRETFRRLFGREPTTWGRRRFGLAPLLPQLLARSGYHSALHFLLDDGLYPDAEQSKVRWEGCDGTVVDAMSRIPLAAEGATSYLRFAMRMAESMEEDQAAALMLARWPDVEGPWFEDLVRIHRYAPCLGRFVTLDDFFQHTDTPGRLSSYAAHEYLGPFLTQAVASRDSNPVSRYLSHFRRRARFDAAAWCDDLSRLLGGKRCNVKGHRAIEDLIEGAGDEADSETAERGDQQVSKLEAAAAGRLGDAILGPDGSEPGLLAVNTMSFPRTVTLRLPDETVLPENTAGLRGLQQTREGPVAIVELPAAGFAWLPSVSGQISNDQDAAALAEGLVLRNEFFELHISDLTGGIAQVKGYGRKPNLLSQQLAFRFPRERTIVVGEGEDAKEITTWYSEMVCRGVEVIEAGPHLGEMLTHGVLLDKQTGEEIASFRQRFRTIRYRPAVDVEIELELIEGKLPEGDPWSNYFAARFAYGDATAAITRSVLAGAQAAGDGRFESPDYVEIANETSRVTIVGPGLPFYRKIDSRMIDAILVPEGELQRTFAFRICVDQPYPMAEVRELLVPPVVCRDRLGPPPSGLTGWFFHVDARNVQITRLLDLVNEPPYEGEGEGEGEEWAEYDQPALPDCFGFCVRLQETEGRHRSVTLRCWRTPSVARQRDLQGRTLADLPIEGDGVRIDLTAHEIADVELRFE